MINLLSAQTNIVPNPSFETTVSCPTGGAGWTSCANWNNVNMNLGAGAWGTPDYFHPCGTGLTMPPATFAGTCTPQSGNAFMALVCYNVPFPNYREYLSTQLSCSMTPGNTYTVSFWITNGTGIKSPWTIKNIGVHFSALPLTQTGWGVINVVPQCEVTSQISTTVWTQYTFTINPTATWNYLTIGAFRQDALNSPLQTFPNPGGNPSVYCNYFVDNIQVIAPGNNVNAPTISPQITGNPCIGGMSVTIVPSNPNLNLVYVWSSGGYTSNIANNINSGSYTVTALGTNGCQTFSTNTQFTIPAVNVLSVSVNSSTVCPNNIAVLTPTVTGGSPAYSYTWLPSMFQGQSFSVNPTTTSNYTLIVKDQNNCIQSKITTVQVSQIKSDFTYFLNPCSGYLNLANSSIGQNSNLWNFGDNSFSNLLSPSHQYTVPGNYILTLIVTNSLFCADTIQKTITILEPSKSSFDYTLSPCDSIALFNNTSSGSFKSIMRFGDGSSQNFGTNTNHIYQKAGTFSVWIITESKDGCKDSSLKILNVIKPVKAAFNFSADKCGNLVKFQNASGIVASSNWFFGNNDSSNVSSPTYNYPIGGVYSVSLEINRGTLCNSKISQTLVVNQEKKAEFKYDTNICNGLVSFTNTSKDMDTTIWYFGDGTVGNLTKQKHNYKPGTYIVMLLTSKTNTCYTPASASISISYTSVTANFQIKEINENEFEFRNQSNNATKFTWYFDNKDSCILFEPPKLLGDYQSNIVCLVAKNELECSDTLCNEIEFGKDWTLYVPNTFSPNYDDCNEIFKAVGTNISDFKMLIFNQWGQELFECDSLEQGWDGYYKGMPSPKDIYTWKIEFMDLKHKAHQMSGFVYLHR